MTRERNGLLSFRVASLTKDDPALSHRTPSLLLKSVGVKSISGGRGLCDWNGSQMTAAAKGPLWCQRDWLKSVKMTFAI